MYCHLYKTDKSVSCLPVRPERRVNYLGVGGSWVMKTEVGPSLWLPWSHHIMISNLSTILRNDNIILNLFTFTLNGPSGAGKEARSSLPSPEPV